MNTDFHYYATYCAALLAGYTHEESLTVAYCAELTDNCTKTFLSKIKAPRQAATSQLKMEMMDANTDILGLQDITRTWASFHFLPYDLYAKKPHCSKMYLDKYRLICGPNSDLLVETMRLAQNKNLQTIGLVMHVLADTWAHRYFAGTTSLVINNSNDTFREILPDGSTRPITFSHNPGKGDDLERGIYTATVFRYRENSIMNLGHGRAGFVPDYSFLRYRYQPAWADYAEVEKDNPAEFYHAFRQMVYALRVLRTPDGAFEKERYADVSEHEGRIMAILTKRQGEDEAGRDWQAFGEALSGQPVVPFDLERYQEEYRSAPAGGKNDTFLGKYILAALAQKSMVTNRIYTSGNLLAGRSVNYEEHGLRGLRDYWELVLEMAKEREP